MENNKITSEELGQSIFSLVISMARSFLDGVEKYNTEKSKFMNLSGAVKRENVKQYELLSAYLWLVFYILNISGKKYEKTAGIVHTIYANSLKLPETEKASVMKHLFLRYDEYKKYFSLDSEPDFKKFGLGVAFNILGKTSGDIVFHVTVNSFIKSLFVELEELIKETELVDKLASRSLESMKRNTPCEIINDPKDGITAFMM